MTPDTLRVALAQVTSSDDPGHNLETIEHYTRDAVARGAQMVVFPEAMMCRFGNPLDAVSEPLSGPWATAVGRIAEDYAVAVIAGMFTPSDEGRVRNTMLVARSGGATHYDKIHLYDAFGYRESDTVAAGDEPVVFAVDDVTIGVATCYDLRFPELFTTLADRGADVTVVCASWGRGPGKVEQWSLLTRARALDSTTFVIACGQADPAASGDHVEGTAPLGVGYSAVCAPDGRVVAQAGPAPELMVVDLDLSEVAQTREVLPVLANRRPGVVAG